MGTIKFDLSRNDGKFKIMHAVNNGPVYKRYVGTVPKRNNLEEYKALRIPYARNHDASYYDVYGGEHTVDISAIFPNFDADVNDPASYDFVCTDEYIAVTALTGTETFYRLGQKIEHTVKKFHIHPPKDFEKWAQICEHIIRHYNEGWADGFNYNIQYWEIWNEPDLHWDRDDPMMKPTWSGTREQFFDLFETCAKHLKKCFPTLKIGGPALAGSEEWAKEFLFEMKKRNAPLDFFSWHIYCDTPEKLVARSERIKQYMLDAGFDKAESILNEWNYVHDWSDTVTAFRTIINTKGAAFTMACMSAAQHSSTDMLMYYDARPTLWNGLFDAISLKPIIGYYPFKWFSHFYANCEREVLCESNADMLYTLCGVDRNGKAAVAVTYYSDTEALPDKEIAIDLGRSGEYEVYYIDDEHNPETGYPVDRAEFTLKHNTCIMIKEK